MAAAKKKRIGKTGKDPKVLPLKTLQSLRSLKKAIMKNYLHILIALLTLILSACQPDEPRNGELDWAVQVAWQNGLSGSRTTRALPATSILADGTSDINIDFADYPATISVVCKKEREGASGEYDDIQNLTLNKGTAPCTEHPGYWSYTPSFLFRDQLIKREDYKFFATATIDGGDDLVGEADKDDIKDTHLKLTLHHTKALLRFAFKVSENYSKVRYIRVTNINLNGTNCELVDKVLTTSGQFIAYCYIDPAVVTVSKENTIRCTYNIYDKDAVFPIPTMTEVEKEAAETELRKHLTREGVVAQNKFTLGSLKDASSSPVTTIRAGYYYDLRVTLNPDYLYVLSEHDNKHLTIE